MNFDPIAGFVAFGGIIGSGAVVKFLGSQTAKRLEKHEENDNKFHTETIDRLARIETKIDALTKK